MINFNGKLIPKESTFLNHNNRGLRYGDALFETFRMVNGKIIFWEEHYLRLMASMRILRMEIPMTFTMEFLEEQLLETAKANSLLDQATRIRLTVFRNNGGVYLPTDLNVSYVMEMSALSAAFYTLSETSYEVALYKDFFVNPDMLSTLKTNNKIIHVLGSVYAKENGYQNCLLLNQQKEVVEALNGNLFLVKDRKIITPPLRSGCLNGIIRKQLLKMVENIATFTVEEAVISPFELQRADELFITNAVEGIVPITKYRKKKYETKVSKEILGKLNAAARLV